MDTSHKLVIVGVQRASQYQSDDGPFILVLPMLRFLAARTSSSMT
jgi:hypothetical protein